VAAEAVVFAAGHAGRKEYWAGGSTAATIFAQKFAAPVLDRYLGRTGYKSQQTDQREAPGKPGNLWEPLDEAPGTDHGAHGEFDDKSRDHSNHDRLSEVSETAGTTVAEAAEKAGAVVTRAFGSLITTARRRK
jgi:hypothetical protein